MKSFLLLLIMLSVFPWSAKVEAQEIACGDILLEDTKLETNLDCRGSGADGLVIGSDNVTIDLNGYTVLGDVTAFAGISSDGFFKITIKNGAIDGFQVGGYVLNSRDVVFEDLTLAHQAIDGIGIGQSRNVTIEDIQVSLQYETGDFETTGVALVDVEGAIVERLAVEGAFYGLKSDRSRNVKIGDSRLTNIAHVGVRFVSSNHAMVKNIGVVGVGDFDCYSAVDVVGPGPSKHIRIQDNVLTECSHGVFVVVFPTDPPSTKISIRDNRIRQTADGIILIGVQDSEVIGNRVHFNYSGIRLWDYSYNNRIARNLVTGNIDWDLFHDPSSAPNSWTDNTCLLANMDDIDCP